MRVLGEWVVRRVLQLERNADQPWGVALVRESARRNAKMVAGWQAYGFMVSAQRTPNLPKTELIKGLSMAS